MPQALAARAAEEAERAALSADRQADIDKQRAEGIEYVIWENRRDNSWKHMLIFLKRL